MNDPITSTDERPSRAAMLDRIYRRISRLDDNTLAQLDRLTDTAGSIEFAEDQPELARAMVNRRAFIITLLLGSIAAAGGGGTALLLNQRSPAEPAVSALSTPTLQGGPEPTRSPSPTPGLPPDVLIDDLEGQLSSVQGERIALRVELEAARDTIAQLENTLQQSQSDATYLQQVVGLYRQLEDTGLDAAILAGMGPVGLALLAIGSGSATLETGIQEAARLLATVEVQSPTIANGLLWLEEQVNYLSQTLQALEDALSDVLDPVRPITDQIGTFIGQVLDALPFGVGAHVRSGLEAVAAILSHVPELVASINPLVLTPLRQWVSPDEDKGLVAEVVRPISENLISPAQGMVDGTNTLETAYRDQLETPVQNALAARSQIRQTLDALIGAT